jgi:ubiquinone/menaquinone biosynthesis C-methylase UbiE
VQCRRFPVLDVHAHLDAAGPWQVQPQGADSGKAAVTLADNRRDRPCIVERRPAKIDVERDQRPPRANDDTARARIQLGRAEVRLELSRREPAREAVRATLPKEGRTASRRKLAVEEHRQRELVADAPAELERGGPSPLHVARAQGDDRNNIRRSDPRMCTLVVPQVDPLASDGDPGEQRLDQHHVVTDQREHRPVVVGIGMDVEKARTSAERRPDRVDRLPVAPFGEVGHRLERKHDRTLGVVKAYYEARAREYDDWWNWHVEEHPEEYALLISTIESLEPANTLDVACGTGFLTRHLPGEVTGIDQSPAVLEIATEQAPDARFVQGEGIELPFEDGAFDRIFTSHFYGHLEEPDRRLFLDEARRVGHELVVVDSSARHPGARPDGMQPRVLKDGTRWEVYKRYLAADGLAAELGGGEVLLDGVYFVVVRV